MPANPMLARLSREEPILLEITPEAHGVLLDLAYATVNNFTGAPVYGRAACYLHPEAFAKPERARDLAAAQGLRRRIFDAFRPAEAQWILWTRSWFFARSATASSPLDDGR